MKYILFTIFKYGHFGNDPIFVTQTPFDDYDLAIEAKNILDSKMGVIDCYIIKQGQ